MEYDVGLKSGKLQFSGSRLTYSKLWDGYPMVIVDFVSLIISGLWGYPHFMEMVDNQSVEMWCKEGGVENDGKNGL